MASTSLVSKGREKKSKGHCGLSNAFAKSNAFAMSNIHPVNLVSAKKLHKQSTQLQNPASAALTSEAIGES